MTVEQRARELYEASVARVITGRTFDQLGPNSQSYWLWKARNPVAVEV